jgi:hypothetical protein
MVIVPSLHSHNLTFFQNASFSNIRRIIFCGLFFRNNVGVYVRKFELSEDGMEKIFATNHIG